MAQNKVTAPIIASLSVSNKEFKENILERINLGEELFNREANDNNAFDVLNNNYLLWNDYNSEYLKQVFNTPDNEYRRSYIDSGYSFMGQLGEVRNNPYQTLRNLIKYRLDNLKSLEAKSGLPKSDSQSSLTSHPNDSLDKTSVFIVHGHDDLAKTKTARFIEKLGFNPIVLHEQSNSGKTIIEKIEEYSNVGFGIVLYTPCDIGTVKGNESYLQPRARQNVVFEHGFLIGKIGRNNVCALIKNEVEVPNDISGVVYIKMDDDDAWHLKVAKELRSSGYNVDMNKL